MAVYTRFGTEVEVVAVDLDEGIATVRFPDGEERDWPLLSLRADGGSDEILAAANQPD